MEYAVYVAVPAGDDSRRIAQAARDGASNQLGFSVRENGDPSEGNDVELCFRIHEVSEPEEAIARALEIYALGRRAAGLRADPEPRAKLLGDE
jgi:hypothetical protein